MARTNTDRIDELYQLVYTLTQRLDELRRELDQTHKDIEEVEGKADRDLAEARRSTTAELVLAVKSVSADLTDIRRLTDQLRIDAAVQKRDLDDLRARKEEWGRRGWQIVAGLILALAGGVIGYLLRG